MQKSVHKCLAESQSVDVVATRMIYAPAFTVPVIKFTEHEVEKGSLDRAKIEEQFNRLTEAVDEK